jgi:type IV secretory pathway VirB4 component
MSRNRHRARLVAEAKAQGLCRPPPKPGAAERHRQQQINVHAKYVRKAWLQVVRDDKVSYRQRMDADLARREAAHQKQMAEMRQQLEQAQIAADRSAEEANRSAEKAARIAAEAAHEAKQTQARHSEYRTALASAISTVKDMAACELAKEKTATRTLDQQLSKRAPASRQLLALAEKMSDADRKWNRAVYYY